MSERRFRRTPGGVLPPGLHLMSFPKYRRRILRRRVTRRLGVLLEQIVDAHCWHAVAKEVTRYHARQCVRVDPANAPAQVEQAFNRRTMRKLRQRFPFPHRHAKVLWSLSYFAASSSFVSESMVRRYIDHRWDAVA